MHWKTAMPQASIGQKGPTSPNHMSHDQCFKSWKIGCRICLICHIHDLSPTTFFKKSLQLFAGKCFHNQQEAEIAFHMFIKSQGMDFYAIGINKLFLVSKNVLIIRFILINKDVLSLVIMIQNSLSEITIMVHTNLIYA